MTRRSLLATPGTHAGGHPRLQRRHLPRPSPGPDGKEKLIATVTGVEGIVQVPQGEDALEKPRRHAGRRERRVPHRAAQRRALVIPPDRTDHARSSRHRQSAPGDQRQRRDQDADGDEVRPHALRDRSGGAGARIDHRQPQRHPRRARHRFQRVRPAAVPGARRAAYAAASGVPRPQEAPSSFGSARRREDQGRREQLQRRVASRSARAVVDPGARLAPAGKRKTSSSPPSSPAAQPSQFDCDKGIRVVRGGNRRATDAAARPHAPRRAQLRPPLDPTGHGPELRLHRRRLTPPGEGIYPSAALATTASGATTAFDHRGGPNGGIEVVFFPSMPPDGLYGLGLTLISGPPTTAQVDAFLNGQRIDIFDGQQVVQSASIQVVAPIAGFVDGTAAGVVPINVNLPSAPGDPASRRTAPPTALPPDIPRPLDQ